VYKSQLQESRARAVTLDDRWFGPYRVEEVMPDSTYYRLEELDETPLTASFAENRLKKFFTRDELQYDRRILGEFQDMRETAIKDRQARSARPDQLTKLMKMIDAARGTTTDAREENSAGELNDE